MSFNDAPSRRNRPAPLDVHVEGIEPRAGGFLRVTLGGKALDNFGWPGPASHLKFFPLSEDYLHEHTPADSATAIRRISRTYTPRSFDTSRRTLDIDFLLHGAGVAVNWASAASLGARVQVSVPRATYRVDPSADWLLLAGDDSAVPAIGTIIDSGIDVPTKVIIETISPASDRPELPEHPSVSVTWVNTDSMNPGASLMGELRDSQIPMAGGAVWVACEALAVRRIRQFMIEERGLTRGALITRGYWRQGATNHPDHDFGEDLLQG